MVFVVDDRTDNGLLRASLVAAGVHGLPRVVRIGNIRDAELRTLFAVLALAAGAPAAIRTDVFARRPA